MISTTSKFVFGFLVGSLVVVVITYGSGTLLENMGVKLYGSESDQQRNFNIVIGVCLVVSSISGYLTTKLWKKTNKSN